MPDLFDQLLALALQAATDAGALLVEALDQGPARVEAKSTPTDPVSDLDRASEKIVVDTIRAARPGDSFLAEEGGEATGSSGVRWVIDPLDGTVNYVYRFPAFAVSVAAEVDGAPAVGVVHDPQRGETFTAVAGRGAFLGGRRLRVNRPLDLAVSLVGTGFAYDAGVRARQGRVIADVLPRVRDIRRAGSAALDVCWVGAGRLDAYYESGTHHWDRAAAALVATEAGAWVG
ncbi:MAG TPA: inositol monophosphatase family protein, partial [Acidimicrobiales bacterium]|nr:inositol monophosphatase family protein [Acidimicrobiales bacterium]